MMAETSSGFDRRGHEAGGRLDGDLRHAMAGARPTGLAGRASRADQRNRSGMAS